MEKQALFQIKETLYNHCLELIEQKVQLAQDAIQSANDSIAQEGKSSMGDKYETGKAMLDLEKEKLQGQLAASTQLKRTFLQINPQIQQDSVAFGSLVITNQGNYLFSVGLGKISMEKKDYFVISLLAPLGKALLGKNTGDEVIFQKRKFVIEQIV